MQQFCNRETWILGVSYFIKCLQNKFLKPQFQHFGLFVHTWSHFWLHHCLKIGSSEPAVPVLINICNTFEEERHLDSLHMAQCPGTKGRKPTHRGFICKVLLQRKGASLISSQMFAIDHMYFCMWLQVTVAALH